MGSIRSPNESLWARKRILSRELQVSATKSTQYVVGIWVLHKYTQITFLFIKAFCASGIILHILLALTHIILIEVL